MISVVCVYNNERILNDVLLKSLNNQTVEYELILLDNTGGCFKSAAAALNYGGKKATGDYIMFIHQDMWLDIPTWIEDAERHLNTLPDIGIAGVLGITGPEYSTGFGDIVKYSITLFENEAAGSGPVSMPEKVACLDECLLIVPRHVFKQIKFDEIVFDGWDCYAADYCMAIKSAGLKAYVVPGPCSHCCLRRNHMLWEFKDLLKYNRRMYKKYKKQYKIIHAFMATITWRSLQWQAIKGLIAPVYYRVFPTVPMIIKKNLGGCSSVLDLGCGYISPLANSNIKNTIGVDMSFPALMESKRHRALTDHVMGDILEINFKPKSVDAVIAVNLLEYLNKEDGNQLILRMEHWAKKKVLIISRKAFSAMDEPASDWQANDFRNHGYSVKGLSEERDMIVFRYPRPVEVIINQYRKILFSTPEHSPSLLATKDMKK